MFKSNIFRLFVLLLAFQSPSYAADKDIGGFVDNLMNSFFSITKSTQLTESQKVQKARDLLEANLDFDWMGKFVLGRNRRDMKDKDLKDFLQVYKLYLVNTYADAVRSYKGEAVVVKNVYHLSDDEYVVKTTINKLDQDPISVHYLVRRSANKQDPYKVFDVVTEGVSMISSQQAEFGSIIGSSGIRVLIEDLKKKT
ncbi:MAG: ABC transporter substrate-binding protein [Pseudomonadota bacterium]